MRVARTESPAPFVARQAAWWHGPSTVTASKRLVYDALPTSPLRSRAPLVLRV
jgi:hypothetical protein